MLKERRGDKMEQNKQVWNSSLNLKTWKKIIIALFMFSLIGALSSCGAPSSNSSNSNSTSESEDLTEQSTPEPTKAAVSDADYKAALAKMIVKSDTVEDYKAYRPISSPRYLNANGFFVYIVQPSGSEPYLRFRIQYHGEDWLFINSFFFNVDGEKYKISTSYGEIERDNNSEVWEWYDVAPNSENIEMLQKIMNSKKTVMRMEGTQYYKDKTITEAQKSAIRDTFVVFQGMGGSL
jgi:hypothetical protein